MRGSHLTDAGLEWQHGAGPFARMLAGGIDRLLARIDNGLECGTIDARLPDGTCRRLGGRAPGFHARIELNDWRALVRLATGGSVGWYRAWELEEWASPDLVPLFALFMANAETLGAIGRAKGPWRLASRFAHWLNRNTRTGSARNIRAHYDLGNDFYREWLDPTLSYSSALFGGDEARSLEAAQQAKVDALAERLGEARTGQVLEVGCGWGFLACRLAASFGADVTAISLSDEQLEHGRQQAAKIDLTVDFRKQDYRDTSGQFDAVVSVEMVEALGRKYWPAFMDCVARNLKPGGRAAIQFIAMADSLFDEYAASADFIQTFIFPGGLLIRASEFRRLAEARGLEWRDELRFGQDYAQTLKLWRENFDRAALEGRLPPGFDDRFQNLWRFYLMYCEGGFRGGGIDVLQVTLVRAY